MAGASKSALSTQAGISGGFMAGSNGGNFLLPAPYREFGKAGKSRWHYYISSATLSPEALLSHARLEWAAESEHWLLDVHFTEDKTRVWDMNIQKILNTARKIPLNMVRLFKAANLPERVPLTSVFKGNLFDASELAKFLDFFSSGVKLD